MTDELPSQENTNLESKTLADGISCEWLDEGRIVVHTAKHLDSDEIRDSFLEMVKETMQSWNPEQIFLQLLRFPTASMIHFSAETRQKLSATGEYASHLQGRAAVVVPRTFLNMAVRIFVNRDIRAVTPQIEMKIFHNQAVAEEWLRELLED